MKNILTKSFLFLSLTSCSAVSLAGNGPGDLSPSLPPIGDDPVAHTVVLHNTVVSNQSATQYSYQSVDGDGNIYTAFIDTATGEVSASSSETTVSNVLSPAQMSTVQSKYTAAGSPQVAASAWLIAVPVAAAATMCYVNDQITKARQTRHCESQGQTVVYENTGICGQLASFRCEINPFPRPAPRPLPTPTPTPPSHGYWTLPSATNISSQFQLVVNTYDGDWFNN